MRNGYGTGSNPMTSMVIGFRMDSQRRREEREAEERKAERQRRVQVQADNAQAFNDAHRRNGGSISAFGASGDGRFTQYRQGADGMLESWDSMAGNSMFAENQAFSKRIGNAGRAAEQDAKQRQLMKDRALSTIAEKAYENNGWFPPSMLNELNAALGNDGTKFIGAHYTKNGDLMLYGENKNGARGPMMMLNRDQVLAQIAKTPGIGMQLGQQIYNDKIKSGLSPESIFSSTGYKLQAAMDRNQVMRERNQENAAIQREKIQAGREAAEAKSGVGGRAPSERDFEYARDDFERLNGIISNKDGAYSPDQIADAKAELAWKREAFENRVYGKKPDRYTKEQREGAAKAIEARRRAKEDEERRIANQKAAFDNAFEGGMLKNSATHSNGGLTFQDENGRTQFANPGAIISFGGKDYRWNGNGMGKDSFEPVNESNGDAERPHNAAGIAEDAESNPNDDQYEQPKVKSSTKDYEQQAQSESVRKPAERRDAHGMMKQPASAEKQKTLDELWGKEVMARFRKNHPDARETDIRNGVFDNTLNNIGKALHGDGYQSGRYDEKLKKYVMDRVASEKLQKQEYEDRIKSMDESDRKVIQKARDLFSKEWEEADDWAVEHHGEGVLFKDDYQTARAKRFKKLINERASRDHIQLSNVWKSADNVFGQYDIENVLDAAFGKGAGKGFAVTRKHDLQKRMIGEHRNSK